MAQDDRLGVSCVAQPRKIVVDFSSPNVAKPMHVGHIRSTILGDCLVRVARFLGHDVIADNHIGDWGTQFGKVIYGWKHFLDREALEKDAISELVRLYREVNRLEETDETIKRVAREELVKLQAGDPENFAIWQQTVELSWREFEKLYTLLDIRFDERLGESAYNDALAPSAPNSRNAASPAKARAHFAFSSPPFRHSRASPPSFAKVTVDSSTPPRISQPSSIASATGTPIPFGMSSAHPNPSTSNKSLPQRNSWASSAICDTSLLEASSARTAKS